MTPEQKLAEARARIDAAASQLSRGLAQWYREPRAIEFEDARDALIAAARAAGAAEAEAKACKAVADACEAGRLRGRDEERAKVNAAWRARIVEGSEGWSNKYPDAEKNALIRLPLPDEAPKDSQPMPCVSAETRQELKRLARARNEMSAAAHGHPMGSALPDEGYAQVLAGIDPGVRSVVTALWAAGIVTTDSGDGSKHGHMEGALDCQHVAFSYRSFADAYLVLDVIASCRPHEEWQVEISRSVRTHARAAVVTGIAYRLEGDRDE